MASVWIYVDTSRPVGDPGHITAFADSNAALAWVTVHDPDGVAFEYEFTGTTKNGPSLGGS
jgi:hypothetical protein